MNDTTPSRAGSPSSRKAAAGAREERLKAALRANMARRKAQMRARKARAAGEDTQNAGTTGTNRRPGSQGCGQAEQ